MRRASRRGRVEAPSRGCRATPISELDAATLRSLVTFRDLGSVASRWAALAQPVTDRERVRIEALREVLVDRPLTLLDEATIGSRAIYPMVIVALLKGIVRAAQS